MRSPATLLSVLVPAAVVALAAPLAPTARAQDADQSYDVTPSLTVTGRAELDVAPDEVRLVISIVTEGDDNQTAAQVMNTNSEKAQKVVASLRAAGLGEKEVTTSRFNVFPRYTNPGRRNEPPRIAGYRVENEVRVVTKKIEKAAELIQTAVDAGANQVSSISFGLSDERARRADVIAQATANARSDAKALAAAAGVTLVRTIRVDLDQQNVARPQPMIYQRAAAEVAAVAPPIQPADVQVSAQVTIVYEIEDAGEKVGLAAPGR